jgi:hypothetical protein
MATHPESSWPWKPNLVGVGWFYIAIALKSGAVITGVPVSAPKLIQQQSRGFLADHRQGPTRCRQSSSIG